MIRPVMIATMALGTLAIVIVAWQLVDLNAEIIDGGGLSRLNQRIFDLPPHFLLLFAVLPASLAIVGIWRRF